MQADTLFDLEDSAFESFFDEAVHNIATERTEAGYGEARDPDRSDRYDHTDCHRPGGGTGISEQPP